MADIGNCTLKQHLFNSGEYIVFTYSPIKGIGPIWALHTFQVSDL